MKRIAITTGDQDGIGPEVTLKALKKSWPGVQFFVFRGKPRGKDSFTILKKFKIVRFHSLEEALAEAPLKKNVLIDIVDDGHPGNWVAKAAVACREGLLDGMVTAPLSKESLKRWGSQELGHTEILQKICPQYRIFQGYLGPQLNVLLATAHLPLRKVASALNAELLTQALHAATALRAASRNKKPIALLGLNPHAGEGGLIGSEERIHHRVLKKFKRSVVGPLVPDVAFQAQRLKKHSVFVACYHDQGLIPFKMIHGQRHGVQVSMGLPFVRTSVDHGTAKDIAGRGVANPGSMIEAISWCLRLIRQKRTMYVR